MLPNNHRIRKAAEHSSEATGGQRGASRENVKEEEEEKEKEEKEKEEKKQE